MSTIKNANAKTAVKSTKVEKAQKELAKKNVEKATEKVEASKEKALKYIYPKDAISKLDKKAYRRKMRTENKRFEKQMKALRKSNEPGAKTELVKIEKAYKAFRKEHYNEQI